MVLILANSPARKIILRIKNLMHNKIKMQTNKSLARKQKIRKQLTDRVRACPNRETSPKVKKYPALSKVNRQARLSNPYPNLRRNLARKRFSLRKSKKEFKIKYSSI